MGQERYRALNKQYNKKADGYLLLYDITKNESYEEIKIYYIKEIKEKYKKDIKIMLLGNKTDLEDER